MATVEQWDEFARELAEQQEIQRQNLNDILNDPDASQATKDKAVNDFIQQEYYNDWIQEQNEQIQITGMIPVSLTIPDKTIHGALWIDAADNNKIKSGTLESFTRDQIINSDRVHIADLDGTPIDLWIVDNTGDPPTPQIKVVSYYYDSGSMTMGLICYNTNNDGQMKWRFGASNSYYESPAYYSQNRNGFCCWIKSATSSIPTHNGFDHMADVAPTTSPRFNGENLLSLARDYLFEGGVVDPDAPWDFYNDEVLPNVDPGNAFFPDGYEPPFNPDDPSDDPTTDPDTLPHDDGDTPLPFQEGNQIDAPSMFITQYICTKSDLTLLGVNLWSSWVDPNAGGDTAKNFVFDYFQDTGTFNITTALDYIISLRVFPFAFSQAHISMGVSDGIYIGTGHTNFTNQSLNVLNEVNGWIDAGKRKVLPEEPYNDFRDMYNCTIQLYMPFCGSLELNPVEVINREVSVRYYIDFQSACCTAVAFVQGDKGKYPIGSKSGQIGFTLPITATNSGQLAAQFASDATRALGTVGNFGMQLAKAALAASTAQAGGEMAAAKSPEYASQISQSTSLQLKGINQGVVGSTGNLGLDLANQAIDMLSRSGVGMPLLSGGGGCESLMFQAGCTIQIRRGKYVNLEDIQYGHMQGNALAETKPISEFSGFCKFAGVDTTGLTCHNDERNEILSLLESGIYV